MAIAQYTITSAAWTAISSAGQSGSCWLDENTQENSGADDVRIVHGASAPVYDDLVKGRRVRMPKDNKDMLLLAADNASDIFYARSVGGSAVLSVDMV